MLLGWSYSQGRCLEGGRTLVSTNSWRHDRTHSSMSPADSLCAHHQYKFAVLFYHVWFLYSLYTTRTLAASGYGSGTCVMGSRENCNHSFVHTNNFAITKCSCVTPSSVAPCESRVVILSCWYGLCHSFLFLDQITFCTVLCWCRNCRNRHSGPCQANIHNYFLSPRFSPSAQPSSLPVKICKFQI